MTEEEIIEFLKSSERHFIICSSVEERHEALHYLEELDPEWEIGFDEYLYEHRSDMNGVYLSETELHISTTNYLEGRCSLIPYSEVAACRCEEIRQADPRTYEELAALLYGFEG